MDLETVTPRTCQECGGAGYFYFGDKEEYDVQPCEACNATGKDR
jgi:DnaJ-class molecular chaperone